MADNERMSDLCREYGISRKTAYGFRKRFEQRGLVGLEDQSRAPRVIPHKTPPELQAVIVAERKLHPTWGGKKLKEVLESRLGRRFPSAETIASILKQRGLVQPRRKRRRHEATRHERMHRTLKFETARPARANLLQ